MYLVVIEDSKNQVNKKTLYKIYIRKLDKVSSTECLFYIYLANSLCYTKPNLS